MKELVRELLVRCRLGQYVAAFEEEGYDDREFLLSLDRTGQCSLVITPAHPLITPSPQPRPDRPVFPNPSLLSLDCTGGLQT